MLRKLLGVPQLGIILADQMAVLNSFESLFQYLHLIIKSVWYSSRISSLNQDSNPGKV